MTKIKLVEAIARDATCAQGEFKDRVLSLLPYLTEPFDEIARLRTGLNDLIQRLPGGQSVDPQWVADELRKIVDQ